MGLDGVEIVMEIEEYFDIKLAEHEVQRTDTVGKFIELVWMSIIETNPQKKMSVIKNDVSTEIAGKPWTKGEVREIIREIIEKKLHVKDFADDASFVDDLGMQ